MPSFAEPNQNQNRLCIIGEADPFLARLLQRFAEKSGLWIKRALTGEDVLDLAHRDRPVLIILEPELPGKVRGWEAARTLWLERYTSTIPLILCTWLMESDAQALIGHRFPHLQKPDLHYKDFSTALDLAGVETTAVSDDTE